MKKIALQVAKSRELLSVGGEREQKTDTNCTNYHEGGSTEGVGA
jgi:hypothetical protein